MLLKGADIGVVAGEKWRVDGGLFFFLRCKTLYEYDPVEREKLIL